MKISVLSLVFLPLTFGYAIFRYRLMDVDLIFKRGMTYTLATAIVTLLNLLVITFCAHMCVLVWGLRRYRVRTRAPWMPRRRMSRSTVQRATSVPSRRSCRHSLRAP